MRFASSRIGLDLSHIFDVLDPEVSAALERSLAASGMERVLERVLRTGTRHAEPLDTAGSAGSDLLGLFDLAASVAVPAPAKPPSSPTAPGVYAVSGAAVMPRTKGCCPGHSAASPGGGGPCVGTFATGASFDEVSSIMPVCVPPPSVCETKPISPTGYVAAHSVGRSPRPTVSASVEASPSDGDEREGLRVGKADDDADRDHPTRFCIWC